MRKLGYVMNASYEVCPWILMKNRIGGAVGKNVRTANGMFGVRIPAATELSRKNR